MNPLRKTLCFVSGLLFGAGLVVSGMTQPRKVIAFLDFLGHWDPSLALVMVGAILTHHLGYRWAKQRRSPFFDEAFHLPTKKDIDLKLVLGSLLFGAGWGLGGYCPGPGLVSLGALSQSAGVFVLAMMVGMRLQSWLSTKLQPGIPPNSTEAGPLSN